MIMRIVYTEPYISYMSIHTQLKVNLKSIDYNIELQD